MPDPASDANNLFEIVRTTSVDAAAEAGPSAKRPDPINSGGGGVRAKRRKYAALALPGDNRR